MLLDSLKKHKIDLIFLFMFIFCFIIFMWSNNYNAFWFDESFSIILSKRSFTDIVAITSQDVHPPLYFFLLKIFTSIFGDSISTIRFFSLLPILLCLLLTMTVFRKIFGDKIAFYLSAIILMTPIMGYVISEIRMYSWAMFWAFLAGIFAYKVYEKNCIINSFFYVLGSVCAAYTHNYGLLTVFYLYLFLLGAVFINKRDNTFKLFLIGLIIAILYIPWLAQLFSQVGMVKGDFWILPITISKAIGYVYYPFDINYPQLNPSPIITRVIPKLLFMLLSLFVFIVIKAQFASNKKMKNIANICLALYLLPGLTGIVVSLLVKPVFVPRFLLCSLIFLCISCSIYISLFDYSKKLNKVLVGSSLFILLIISLTNFILNKQWSNEKDKIQSIFVDYIKNNTKGSKAFIFHEHAYAPLGVYSVLFPDDVHYLYCDTTVKRNKLSHLLISSMNTTDIINASEIDIKYDNLIAPENYEGKSSVMGFQKESSEISEFFEVKSEINAGLQNYTLFHLKRKKHLNR